MGALLQKEKGMWVLLIFIAFFGLIIVVNSIFIYTALGTHSGVVTEQPYEKGLAFNDTLQKAKSQPALEHQVTYKGGVLRWALPVHNAVVNARVVRPVQDGHDFDIELKHLGGGVYEARPDMPLPGAWTAKLKATWDNTEFQTSHDFIAK